MRGALILNADGNPVSILPLRVKTWQEAILSIYKDNTQPLHIYEDWTVRSARAKFNVPAVLVMPNFVNYKRFVSFSKRHLCVRDAFTCQYCREVFPEKQLTKDHVVPDSHGGPMSWENIVAACYPCNQMRGNNTKIKPAKAPYRPSYFEMVDKVRQYPITVPHESWGYYIGWKPELIKVS